VTGTGGFETLSIVANEMNEYTSINGTARTHDANGNLLFDGTMTYFYDGLNRLVEVRLGSTTIALYAYDYFNRRIRREVPNTGFDGITRYVHTPYQGDVIEEDGKQNDPQRQYVWPAGAGGSLLQYVDSFSQFSFLPFNVHENGYGSIMFTTPQGAEILANQRDYDAYGNFTELGGELATMLPYLFKGWRQDPETAFYCLGGGSYYQASLGRTICRSAGSLLNLYAFMGNGPIPYYPTIYESWAHDFVKWLFDDPDDEPKPKKRDRPVDPSKHISSYNCAGLAFRDYKKYQWWELAFKLNNRNLCRPTDCAKQECKLGELKVYLWTFYRQTREGSPDKPGDVVEGEEAKFDFHVVAGKVSVEGEEPTGVISKNWEGPIESSENGVASDFVPKPQPTTKPGYFQEFLDEKGNPYVPKPLCWCCQDK
jgi:hypothetical protein